MWSILLTRVNGRLGAESWYILFRMLPKVLLMTMGVVS